MKNAKAIFALVLVGTLIYTVYMIAPCYFSNWQFQDDIASLAKFPGTMDDEALRLDAVKKAAAHGILLTSDQILVVREGNLVTITADYSVHVDLHFKQMDLDMHATSAKGNNN